MARSRRKSWTVALCTSLPFSITRTSLATVNASRRSCSTRSDADALGADAARARRRAGARRPERGPRRARRAARSRGLDISARATASICCSPPDRWRAGWLRRSPRRGKQLEHGARDHGPGRGGGGRASERCSAHGQRRRTPGAPAGRGRRRPGRPGRARRPASSRPSMRNAARRGRQEPGDGVMRASTCRRRCGRGSRSRRPRGLRGRPRAARCRAGSRPPGRRPRGAVMSPPRR